MRPSPILAFFLLTFLVGFTMLTYYKGLPCFNCIKNKKSSKGCIEFTLAIRQPIQQNMTEKFTARGLPLSAGSIEVCTNVIIGDTITKWTVKVPSAMHEMKDSCVDITSFNKKNPMACSVSYCATDFCKVNVGSCQLLE